FISDGARILDAGTGDAVVTVMGGLGSTRPLTSDGTSGTDTLEISSTSGLVANDICLLRDATAYNPLDVDYVSGELVRILSVDSGTDLTLATPIFRSRDAT